MGMCKGCGEVFSATEMKDGYCKDCLPEVDKENTKKLRNNHTENYEQAMREAFVGKPDKFSWYEKSFSNFNINGVSAMKWNWSWWAFFGTCWFLIYRKAYLAGLVMFILIVLTSWVPFAGLIIAIFSGGYSTYFVYKIYKAKKDEIEKTIDNEQERIETMKIVGGYNSWVVWLAIILNALIIIGILAAVAIPKLVDTRDDAVIEKARVTVSILRSSMSTERQKRILSGNFEKVDGAEVEALLEHKLGSDWYRSGDTFTFIGQSGHSCEFTINNNKLSKGACDVAEMNDL